MSSPPSSHADAGRDLASPLVSVVVAFHNKGAWIRETLASVAASSFQDYEVVVVDDASTVDERAALLRAMAESGVPQDRFQLIENAGSLSEASGSPRGRAPARRWWQHVNRRVFDARGVFPVPPPSFYYSGVVHFGNINHTGLYDDYDVGRLRRNNFLTVSALIHRAAYLCGGGFDPTFDGHEDYDMWLRFAGFGFRGMLAVDLQILRALKHAGARVTLVTCIDVCHWAADDAPCLAANQLSQDWEGRFREVAHEVVRLPVLLESWDSQWQYGDDGAAANFFEGVWRWFRRSVMGAAPYDVGGLLHRTPRSPPADLALSLLEYVVVSRDADLVFNRNTEVGYAFARHAALSNLTQLRFVDLHHIDDEVDHVGWFAMGMNSTGLGSLEQVASAYEPFVHRHVVISHALESLAKTRFGVPASKLAVIHNGVDLPDGTSTAPATPATPAAPAAVGGHRGPVIVFAGRMHDQKQPLLWVDVAARLHAARPDLRFRMAGSGPLYGDVAAHVRWLGLQDVVQMDGYRSDMSAVLQEADVLLMTSMNEGMPMVVLEAQAVGTAVVAVDVGATAELFEACPSTGELVAGPHHDLGASIAKQAWEASRSRTEAALASAVLRQLDKNANPGEAPACQGVVQSDFSTERMARKYVALFGALASWLTTPLDLIKLRLQVQSATGEAPLSSAAAQAASAAGTADTMGRAAAGASQSTAEGLGHVAVEQKLYRGMLDGLTKVIRGDGVVDKDVHFPSPV
eukprot:g2515.t1